MVPWEAMAGARSICRIPSCDLWARLQPHNKQLQLLPVLPFPALRIKHQFPRQLWICKLEALELSSSTVLYPPLLSAEREEVTAILLLFLREKGVKAVVASTVVKRADGFIDHLHHKLHTAYKSHYIIGKELTTLDIRSTLVPYLEALLEEHGDSLPDVLLELFPKQKSDRKSRRIRQARISLAQVRKPDSAGNFSPLVTYLLNLGMKIEEIEGVVRKFPAFVKHDFSDIKPIVDFLVEAGANPLDLPTVICKCPHLITGSMEKIKSRVRYLQDIGMDKHLFSIAIRRGPHLLSSSLAKADMFTNYLRGIGLSDMKIARVLARAPQIVRMSVEDNLMPTAEYFESIGLDVSLLIQRCPEVFLLCIESKLKWVVEFFLERGFTMEESRTIFNRFGKIFTLSVERNLIPKWEYFVVMGYAKEELLKSPSYFGCSLEMRIKPRYNTMMKSGVCLSFGTFLLPSPTEFEKLIRKEMEKKKIYINSL